MIAGNRHDWGADFAPRIRVRSRIRWWRERALWALVIAAAADVVLRLVGV